MDTFIQQMGRAGRDGKISQELILYKSHKNQIQNLDHKMKLIITDSDCRREIIAECYLTKRNLETVIDHICETKCKCNDIECPRIHAAFSTMDFSVNKEQIRTRNVSVEEEFRTLDKLKLLKESQDQNSSSFITDFERISISAIENIINNRVHYSLLMTFCTMFGHITWQDMFMKLLVIFFQTQVKTKS